MLASKGDPTGLQNPSGLVNLNARGLRLWRTISRRWLSSLRVQILLWTIFPVVLILIAISFTSIYTHQQSMRSLVAQRDSELASTAAARLSEGLTAGLSLLQRLAWQVDSAGGLPPAGFEDLGQVAVLDAQARLVSGWSAVVWEAVTTNPGILDEVQITQTPAISAPFTDPVSGASSVLLAVPLSNGGAVVGLATLAQAGLGGLSSWEQSGRRRTIYLVDRDGRIVYHPDASQVGRDLGQHDGIAEVRQGRSGAAFHRETNGEELVVGYAPIPPAGWGLIVEEPWGDVIAPVMQYALIPPLTVLVAALLSLLAVYFGVRHIIRPLQLLSLQAQHMAWGDFSASQKPVGGVREIEDLRRSLNQMAEQIQLYQSGMHSYIVAITQAQEEERKRIARELHDETVQSLVALAHRVGLAQKVLARDPSQVDAWLTELRTMANATVDSARRFTRDLRPPYLEDLGLVPAIETLANGINRDGLWTTFRVIGVPRRLSAIQELCLYRVAQEALSNVVRHAQASQVNLHLIFSPDRVTLSIEDNGRGFAMPDMPDELAPQGHLGIMGMRERALLLGGHLSVRSAPGRGTKVALHFAQRNTETQGNSGEFVGTQGN